MKWVVVVVVKVQDLKKYFRVHLLSSLLNSKKKRKSMYSLDLPYYTKEFNSLQQLIDDVMVSGVDPNCYIIKNGISIGEKAVEHLTY
jgi:hypothetical protein